ncbi:S-type pyocin domain-containing protein, partial [Klebsiella pneumoniae]|nr:S-type pyocin domain-containing protein [Klebsiella pneumoniae]MDZ2957890.1 S-type pyocin domain-containing protein [Klebsiella pneumoniae]
VSRSYEVGEKSGLDRVRVRFAKQLDKETWGFEDPSIKGTFVWSRSAGQGKFEWGASQTTVHDGSAGGSTTPPTPIPEPRSVWGLPKEGANKQVISSQADSLIKISRIWADFFPA